MKQWIIYSFCAVLFIYSALLVAFEWSTSQASVRPYFADISGPVHFYAVNTSLSVFLLGATGLLFLVALSFTGPESPPREKLFYFSQALLFVYLGTDDRFLLHEYIGKQLHIDDVFVLLCIGLAEATCLVCLARPYLNKGKTLVPLVLAAGLFGLMVIFDGFVPSDMTLRLSGEDLFKTWSCFCFLLFGWSVLEDAALRKRAGTSVRDGARRRMETAETGDARSDAPVGAASSGQYR